MLWDLAIKNICKESNLVLEFGVHTGSTITYFRNRLPAFYNFYGFDSFEGLPEDWTGTDLEKGFFSLNGEVPDIEGVNLVKGWFSESLPEWLEGREPEKIALLHIDCDLYSSTKTVLDNLTHMIQPGTLILFDEWFYPAPEKLNQHEQKAFFEWVLANQIDFTFIESNYHGDQPRKLVKIK